jgi:hypothetical protein
MAAASYYFLEGGVFLKFGYPLGRFDSGWPSGSSNHAAEVAAPEGGILICEHVGLNVAECGLWLVLYPVVESLDDVKLEVLRSQWQISVRLELRRKCPSCLTLSPFQTAGETLSRLSSACASFLVWLFPIVVVRVIKSGIDASLITRLVSCAVAVPDATQEQKEG